MTENTNMSEVVEEIRNASEEELREVIEQWFEHFRTQGMRIGAQFIAAAVAGAIDKNLKKGSQSSLRDYQRAIKSIVEIVSVQLARQNDTVEVEESEEAANDEQ